MTEREGDGATARKLTVTRPGSPTQKPAWREGVTVCHFTVRPTGFQKGTEMTDLLLTRAEAARMLKISDRTLDRFSDLPRVRVGRRRIMYRQSDIEAYIARQIETAQRA